MSFARKKIPVLFFFSGLHMDYHRPTDTADKINYKGMDEVVDLGVKLVEELTTMPRQKYDGRYDAQSMLHLAGIGSSNATGSTHGGSASFGTIPDYSQPDDSKDGMRVGGVVPGSPADKLGIREGDMMVEFNGTPIGNKMDYTMALGKAKPGQKVAIKLKRGEKPLDVEATLASRKSD
jgi:C-terminal processing protease CtpA/Prc